MRVIKPSATILGHNFVSEYQFIEKVGRTCYKSEDKITEDSAEKFVRSLVKREHLAMVEHETIYIEVPKCFMCDFLNTMARNSEQLKYFNITNLDDRNGCYIISGSFRAFYDLFDRMDSFEYFSTNTFSPLAYLKNIVRNAYPLIFEKFKEYPTNSVLPPYHISYFNILSRERLIDTIATKVPKEFVDREISKHLTHTVLFVCDRGVSHEFVRHRPCSFAQESTRYCNYSKDKFGNEITFIEPYYFDKFGNSHHSYTVWSCAMEKTEEAYFTLIDMGATPQEARSVLPNSLKTELIMTATEEEWQHIVNLRYIGTTGAPHPQMKEVMSLIVEDLARESGGRITYEANKETN